MKKTVRKTYRGQVEIKDYDVEKCIKENHDMDIFFNGDKMTLTTKELVSKRTSISKEFKSSIGGKDYKLYGYMWNPKEITL